MKRFLYYLRGVLACKWIATNRSLPPVAFDRLVAATVEDAGMAERIFNIVRLKKDGGKHDIQVVDKELMMYVRNLAKHYNEDTDSFHPEQNAPSSEILDTILYNTIQRYSH